MRDDQKKNAMPKARGKQNRRIKNVQGLDEQVGVDGRTQGRFVVAGDA